MANAPEHELVEDAEIEGLSRPPRIWPFLRGTVVGGVVCVGGAVALSLATPLPENLPGVAPTVEISTPEPSAAAPDPETETETETDVATAPAAPSDEPTTLEEQAADAPAADAAAATDDVTAAEDPVTETAETAPATPIAPGAPDETPDETPAETPGADQDATQDADTTELAALAPAETEPDPDATAAPAPAPTLSLAGPALSVNARQFEPPPAAPLLAVVLEDAGNGALSEEALPVLTMPLTLAIRPEGDASRTLAEQARAFGHEVLVQLPMARSDTETGEDILSAGLAPEALVTRTTRHLAALDMAVGATAPEGAQMATDADAMGLVLSPLRQHGFAYVDIRSGIGGIARRIAEETGTAYVARTRNVPQGATEAQIYQTLESAAFLARQQGTAVVFVTASQAALQALFRWGLEKDGRPVWFAPISAVIARQADAG